MRKLLFMICIGLMALLGCSSIQINSGTEEQRSESKSDEASMVRREWQAEVLGADPPQVMLLTMERVKRFARQLNRLSESIVEKWQEGNAGRGEEIPASEMRRLVDAWLDKERDVLDAWDDIIEDGLQRVRDSRYFDQPMIEGLKDLRADYEQLYSVVLVPNGDIVDYQQSIQDRQTTLEESADQLKRELGL